MKTSPGHRSPTGVREAKRAVECDRARKAVANPEGLPPWLVEVARWRLAHPDWPAVRLAGGAGTSVGHTARILTWLRTFDGVWPSPEYGQYLREQRAAYEAAVTARGGRKGRVDTPARVEQRAVNHRAQAAAGAARQVTAVRAVLDRLPAGRETNLAVQAGRLRLAHPNATLAELAAMCDPPVSKDTLAGRLRRFVEREAVATGG